VVKARVVLNGANRAADLARLEHFVKEWDKVKHGLAVRGKTGYDESLVHYEKFQRLVEGMGLSAALRDN